MAMLTLDCARCPAKRMTHDVLSFTPYVGDDYKNNFEVFVRCRHCAKSSVWQVHNKTNSPMQNLVTSGESLDGQCGIVSLVRPKLSATEPPEHTPDDLIAIFNEGAECLAIGAWNASSAMFRKIVDQISKAKMNAAAEPPTDKRIKFNLKPRLAWLFANGLLPPAVAPLAESIREDANDGVHNEPLGKADALDIQDFTIELLEALYTLPGRLKAAEERRAERRAGAPRQS